MFFSSLPYCFFSLGFSSLWASLWIKLYHYKKKVSWPEPSTLWLPQWAPPNLLQTCHNRSPIDIQSSSNTRSFKRIPTNSEFYHQNHPRSLISFSFQTKCKEWIFLFFFHERKKPSRKTPNPRIDRISMKFQLTNKTKTKYLRRTTKPQKSLWFLISNRVLNATQKKGHLSD